MTETVKGKFIKNKEFYKILILIALPITLQNIIIFMTQMLDTIMLGNLGAVEMSAAALGSQPFFLFNMLIFGIGSGAAVLTAQYWGKGQIEPIKKIVSMIVKIAVFAGILLFIICYAYPEKILALFTKDPLVIVEGAKYLKIIAFSFPLFGFSSVFYISMRSVEVVGVAVLSNLSALFISGFLNFVLIFGKFGFPALGVEGAAIGTLIARGVEFIIAVVFMLFIDKRLKFRPSDLLKADKLLFKDLFVISSPVVINEIMWSVGISMQAAILGNISTAAVAANSIIMVVQQLSTVAAFGVAAASAVLIGKSIGEGNITEARNRGYTFSILSIIIGAVVFVLILLAKGFAIDMYNVGPDVKALANQMIYVSAVTGFFVSIAATGIIGVLRGGGDTKYSLFIEAICLWGIAVPLAYIAAFILNWNPVLVYILMKIDEPIKVILYFIRLKGNKWIRNVTR